MEKIEETETKETINANLTESASENKTVNENEGAHLSKKQQVFQFLKFVGFSISAGVIQFGLNALLYEAIHLSWWLSYLISIVASVVWNFTFNRKFTFKAATNITVSMILALLFYVPFIPLSVFGGNALEQIGWNGLLVTAIMMVINFVGEFFWDKFVVFNDKIVSKIIKKPKN